MTSYSYYTIAWAFYGGAFLGLAFFDSKPVIYTCCAFWVTGTSISLYGLYKQIKGEV